MIDEYIKRNIGEPIKEMYIEKCKAEMIPYEDEEYRNVEPVEREE